MYSKRLSLLFNITENGQNSPCFKFVGLPLLEQYYFPVTVHTVDLLKIVSGRTKYQVPTNEQYTYTKVFHSLLND